MASQSGSELRSTRVIASAHFARTNMESETRFEPREGNWRSSLSLAFAALVVGYVFYAVARPGTQSFLLWHAPVAIQVSEWLDSAPSFLHTFAFAILLSLAGGGDRRRRFATCLAWCAVEVAAEFGQLPSLARWVEIQAPNAMGLSIGRSLLAGTFSVADLAAVLIGAALATCCVCIGRRNKP